MVVVSGIVVVVVVVVVVNRVVFGEVVEVNAVVEADGSPICYNKIYLYGFVFGNTLFSK